MIRRREVITMLGGAAVACPVVARGQQAERVRLVGILQSFPENDPVALALVAIFLKELQQLGWTVGSNISVETRWAGITSDDIRRHAAELVAFAPDIILANGTSTLGPLLQQSKTIPIVFVQVTDPVGSGYVFELGATGRKCDRLRSKGVRRERKVARGTEADRACGEASWRCSQSSRPLRQWAIRSYPSRLTVFRDRCDPD
jgi:ABC-type uncharacterized transport system substrate-binding protein